MDRLPNRRLGPDGHRRNVAACNEKEESDEPDPDKLVHESYQRDVA